MTECREVALSLYATAPYFITFDAAREYVEKKMPNESMGIVDCITLSLREIQMTEDRL